MTILRELENYLSERKRQGEELDRNALIFLHYFGFFDDDWHTLQETGREYLSDEDGGEKSKRSRAEQIVRNGRNRIRTALGLPPKISRLIEIIRSNNFITTPQFKELLYENGLIESPDRCNVRGLLNLVQYLGFCNNYDLYNLKLLRVTQGRYKPQEIMFLLEESVVVDLQEAYDSARDLSGDYGLVEFSLLLERIGEKAKYASILAAIIEAQKDTVQFRMENDDFYFHIGGNKKDGFVSCLGRIFYVSNRVHINEIAEAMRRPIIRRQGAQARDMLPIPAIRMFIQGYKHLHVDGDFVIYTGKREPLIGIEALAERLLREHPEGVLYPELRKFLLENGGSDELLKYLISFSPIIVVDKSNGFGYHRYFLIGGNHLESVKGPVLVDNLAIEDFQKIELEFDQTRQVTQSDFNKMLAFAKGVGDAGEALVNQYLKDLYKARGIILEPDWVSSRNVIAPFDFIIQEDDGKLVFIDVKTTIKDFDAPIHISHRELCKMAESECYRIYRVYYLGEEEICMRVSDNMCGIAVEILNAFQALPYTVVPDGLSISPNQLQFSEEIILRKI